MTHTSPGLIYLFTGEGKGKTSAALGVAVRSVCAGFKVAWISWYKEPSWPISEKKLPNFLPIDFYLAGKGFYLKEVRPKKNLKTAPLKGGGVVTDDDKPKQHQFAAVNALQRALALLRSQQYQLLICDEIVNTLEDSLLTLDQLKKLVHSRGNTHLVLTGRNAPKALIDQMDLVTEMKKIKHPYDKGLKAIKGLDF